MSQGRFRLENTFYSHVISTWKRLGHEARFDPNAWGVRCSVMVLALVVAIALVPFSPATRPALAFAPLPTSELDWNQVADGGIARGSNGGIPALQVYGDYLYAGTASMLACELYRYDGARWEMLVGEGLPTYRAPGFGNSENDAITSMAVFEGALYMGIYNEVTGCELWRHDGTDYQKLVGVGRPGDQAPGFGNARNYSISAMTPMGEYLYLGTYNQDGCELWRYDGATFVQYGGLGPGFGDADNQMVRCMAVYDDALYMGTQNPTDGCDVWRWDGSHMVQVVGQSPAGTFGTGPGFGNGHNGAAASMAEHRGNLYVGTNNSDGCEVWSYAGVGWAMVAGPALPGTSGPGFGDAGNWAAESLASYGAFLYAGTYNVGEGSQVWRTDVSGWSPEADGGLGNPHNIYTGELCEYGSALYASISNYPEGAEVYAAAHNFYFAEGYTGSGFQEYLCLGNPDDFRDAGATITYMFEDGSVQRQSLAVPAGYRATLDVNGTVGAGRNVSALVQSDLPIAAERPIYFSYGAGAWTGGHDAVGATSLSNNWYFAEGYTGPGFEEWICVLNPGDEDAELTFRFQTEELGEVMRDGVTLGAHSRGSYLVNALLGPNLQTSLSLESTQPVVAERPMYFDYSGRGTPRHWNGGHCVMGAPALSDRYYFAEGSTRAGFDEWLTIQNPGIMPITVAAVYQPAPGQGGNVEKTYTLMPHTRFTAYVPEEAGRDKDVSIRLTAPGPFLAERPMYFDYTGFGAPGWTGGHCVIGSTATAGEWFFAEGYTGTDFQEYLCLQNPGDAAAVVQIDYYTQEEGHLAPRAVDVPARSRLNVRVNDNAGPGYQLSCRLQVLMGPEIVVERPMYFSYGPGWTGGHDVVGLRR